MTARALPAWLASRSEALAPCSPSGERTRATFAERTLLALAALVEGEARATRLLACGRLLVGVDARAKLLAALALLVAISATRSLAALGAVPLVAVGLAAASRAAPARLVRDVLLVTLLFTVPVAAPALLATLTPGDALLTVGPATLTREGAAAAGRLVLRSAASVSVALLLVRTTGAPALLAGLGALGVPRAFTLVAVMAHRYLLVLAREVQEMHEGLLARRLEVMSGAAGRAFVVSRLGVLLVRAARTAGEVHAAMLARGYDGVPRALAARAPGGAEAVVVALGLALAAGVLLAPRAGLP